MTTSVLMVSTSYPSSDTDWAGRFIYQLVAALAARDDIRLHLWAPSGPRPQGVVDVCSSDDAAWLCNLVRDGGAARQIRRGVRGAANIASLLWRLRRVFERHRHVDVAHVNWLQNALPLWGLPQRAVISVLGTDYALVKHRAVARATRWALNGRHAILAPNAPWMVPDLEASLGSAMRTVRCVPFGVDQRWLSLQRRPPAGRARMWLVVLRVTGAKIGPLFDWGEAIRDAGDELHLFGPLQEAIEVPDWVHYHGPTHPNALHNEWFPAAAGLITLSQHDEGRPQIVLEAMASGLPVIASDLPAHAELIESGRTGFLVNSMEQFHAACASLRDVETNQRMGRQARAWIEREIGDWDACAERYVQLYRELTPQA